MPGLQETKTFSSCCNTVGTSHGQRHEVGARFRVIGMWWVFYLSVPYSLFRIHRSCGNLVKIPSQSGYQSLRNLTWGYRSALGRQREMKRSVPFFAHTGFEAEGCRAHFSDRLAVFWLCAERSLCCGGKKQGKRKKRQALLYPGPLGLGGSSVSSAVLGLIARRTAGHLMVLSARGRRQGWRRDAGT